MLIKNNKLKKSISFLLIATGLGLAGCGQSPVRNPFAGRSEPQLGALPPVVEMAEARPSAMKIVWSNGALSKQVRFSKLQPYLTGERVFAADHSGKVVALDRLSGKSVWKTSTGKKFSAGPFLVEDHLFLTTSDAKIVAFDARSGREIWEKKVSSEVLAPLAGDQGIVVAHATDGSVTALTVGEGTEVWRVDHSTPALTLRFCSAPVVVDDKVLVGFATGKMLAFDLHTGTIAWERAISVPRGRSEIQRMVDISADPIVIGEHVYAITYQGKLAAVNVTTGELSWERDLSSYQNMAHDENVLFITDNEHHLWAIDRFSGAIVWKQEALAKRYITGPAVINDRVVVADRAGYLHHIAIANGHVIDREHISGKFYQSPMKMGDALLVSGFSGKIVALKLS